ncbi:hypothetical protein HJG60_008595 [Phyllostomus discolor]|uniref:Uncharacterized protein n=1 Tax=Phyllostomus discolor TaxID=89673 RepID=A0A834DLK5_9CHIR|nr:hypothetical protein HJG60_008595 [Phyllostomus discolor]
MLWGSPLWKRHVVLSPRATSVPTQLKPRASPHKAAGKGVTTLPKTRGSLSNGCDPLCISTAASFSLPQWLLHLGLNPRASLPQQPHFRLLPHSASHARTHILPALLDCHHESGQVWPHVLEPIFSKLPRRGG